MIKNTFSLLLVYLCFSGLYAQVKQPNILFFYADDWGRMASCYNDDPQLGALNATFETPAFDRLAKEGARFTNAFYPVAQCTPCRASIATGSYFWRTGKTAFLNQNDGFDSYDAGEEFPGFGPELVKQGYFVATAGKAMEPRWTKAQGIPGIVGGYWYSRHIYKKKTQEEREKTRALIDESYRTVIRNMLKRKKPEQPFYFVFGPINTHRPWPQGSGAELWGLNPEDLKGRLPSFLPDVPEVREDMNDYMGEILALNMQMQCFMEELEKAGELENTVIIATGDNGPSGFSRGKANCFDFSACAPLLVRWSGVVKPGRVIEDFVNLMDLAPTFQEIAGGKAGPEMDGRSILPLLESIKSGQIDPNRSYVVFGRERHFHTARDGNLSYPSRAIRTKDYLYIHNSHENRWPTGSPYNSANLTIPQELYKMGNGRSLAVFRDLDNSPTKGYVMSVRDNTQEQIYWEYAFGKRPSEELFLIGKDPDTLTNVADNTKYASIKTALATRLQEVREATKDPRLTDVFDSPPWTSP